MRPDSPVERVRRWVSRAAIGATLALLTIGLASYHTGSTGLSMTLFRAAFVVLVAMPIVAVVVVLIEELRRRDWAFAGVALIVLGLIAYSIFR